MAEQTWTSLTGIIPNDYFNGVAMIDASTALVVGYAVDKTTDGGSNLGNNFSRLS